MKRKKKNPNKAKRYSEEQKREVAALFHSGQMTKTQIRKQIGVGAASIEAWLKRYPKEAEPRRGVTMTAPPNGNGAHSEPSTALVPFAPIKPDARGRYTKEDRERVLALVDKSKRIVEAAKLSGVPMNTVYGWVTKRRKKRGGALVARAAEPIHVEASPGVTAILGAAQRAFIHLRQAREAKAEAIRTNQSGAIIFTDDFCHGQLAHNALARVMGLK